MSGDAENEYFSDGIAEEILNLLTKLPQLKVSSRTSSFAFKGKDVNIPTVARELGVSTVLEGSVRRAGDHVRITAQLIETGDDSHLWSETYDREMRDVFAIQDDIARSIADALQVTLTPKERRSLQNVATANVRAYDCYLKGRKYFYAMNRRDFLHAVSMYEQAIALDPKYAQAHAGMADAYAFLYRYSNALPENLKRAQESSLRAVELDPDSPEAHAARGTTLTLDQQYAQAEKHFETAILLNPNLYESYYFYGRACMAAGNAEKAARLFVQASEANPADYQSLAFLGQAYETMGRKELAAQVLSRSMALLERHLQMNPDDSRALCFGAVNLAELGQREKANGVGRARAGSRERRSLHPVQLGLHLRRHSAKAIAPSTCWSAPSSSAGATVHGSRTTATWPCSGRNRASRRCSSASPDSSDRPGRCTIGPGRR